MRTITIDIVEVNTGNVQCRVNWGQNGTLQEKSVGVALRPLIDKILTDELQKASNFGFVASASAKTMEEAMEHIKVKLNEKEKDQRRFDLS